MAGMESLVLLIVAVCELILMAFIFCIGRFYELKFKESTYHITFLIPAAAFIAALAILTAAGLELGWGLLLTNACTLIIMMTTGFLLYRKMMGVSG